MITEYSDDGKMTRFMMDRLDEDANTNVAVRYALKAMFKWILYATPSPTLQELTDETKSNFFGFNAIYVIAVAVFGAVTLLIGIMVGACFMLCRWKKYRVLYRKVDPEDEVDPDDEADCHLSH